MKSILSILSATLMMIAALGNTVLPNDDAAPAGSDDYGLAVGEQGPDFTLPDIFGDSITLYEHLGDYRATILHFFYAAGG